MKPSKKKKKDKPKFGLVCYEEPGMPWTRVQGKYQLIRVVDDDRFLLWEIALNKKETCFVPKSSVVVLPNEPTKQKSSSRKKT